MYETGTNGCAQLREWGWGDDGIERNVTDARVAEEVTQERRSDGAVGASGADHELG